MKKTFTFLIIIFSLLITFQTASAITCCDKTNPNNCQSVNEATCPVGQVQPNTGGNTKPAVANPSGNASATTPQGTYTIPNFLGITDPNQLIGRGIKIITGLLGTAALLMFIYGGFLWLTSAGADKKVTKGRDTMIYAAIGLVIVFSAYVIVNYVIEKLGTL